MTLAVIMHVHGYGQVALDIYCERCSCVPVCVHEFFWFVLVRSGVGWLGGWVSVGLLGVPWGLVGGVSFGCPLGGVGWLGGWVSLACVCVCGCECIFL